MTILVAFLLTWYACTPVEVAENSETLAVQDSIPKIDSIVTKDTVKYYSIIGVGDMMLGTNYPSPKYLPPSGGSTMLADVKDYLQNADITFGNLEGTILDEGGTPKRCNNPDACYVFRSPESYGKHFSDAGFDFLSIANNHSGDFGLTGRKKTKEVLDAEGIKYAGLAGSDEMAIVEKNGIKYGMCAFAPNSGTCDIRNLSYAKGIVNKLKEKVDIVIVSFHGGAEGPKNQNVPKRSETYYGENRGDVHAFAHAVIDAGADVVFGHGPHVSRAMELYNGRIIAYSLGNFCTYGRFNLNGPAGIAPMIKVWVDNEGKFQKGEIVSIYQQKAHGPKIDPNKRALKKIQELTHQDFPNSGLEIRDNGEMVVGG
jgi:poly-gamma-glutamate capsule biosynthesis protein CapA/YwtB (metallophosphatase superfamily)